MVRSALFAGVLAGSLLIAGATAARPCDAASLIGTWRLVDIESQDPGVEAFYASIGDEWMRFGADGGFTYLASRSGGGDPASIQSRLDAADAVDGATYRTAVNASGMLVIARDGQIWQAFQCQIAERDEGTAATGDMVLTNLPGAPGVRRVQRLIQPQG